MAKKPIQVEALKHGAATRRNIPTAEFESVMRDEDKSPVQLAYERRNRDLDPQLVWRGKDEQDWSDLIVQAPPLYIQEKVHPKVLVDDLIRQSKKSSSSGEIQLDLFADRTSATTMKANQLRLWFASMAYGLLCTLRRVGGAWRWPIPNWPGQPAARSEASS